MFNDLNALAKLSTYSIKKKGNSDDHIFKNTENLGKKIYVLARINNIRASLLLDTGCDINLISKSALNIYFGSIRGGAKITQTNVTLSDYGNHPIAVLGKIQVALKLLEDTTVLTSMYVIQDIKGAPPLILGSEFLKSYKATIQFDDEEQPIVLIKPLKGGPLLKLETQFCSPDDLSTATAFISLDPFETQEVEFRLHPGSHVSHLDYVLISSLKNDHVNVIPSRSCLQFESDLKCFTATAMVVNSSQKKIQQLLTARIEKITDYDCVCIEGQSRQKLKDILLQHPLGREIITTETLEGKRVICNINLTTKDFVPSQCALGDGIDYSEEALVSNTILDAKGIECPSIIHDSPEEAIVLENFSDELRPFIKKIFLEKYPHSVSLHSLDAGNLSLTLGLTQLRLRDGEMLPRSKRIFHVSPSDRQHLDDITDLLIKFGFIIRSPPDPQGLHLYGMASYLVPRQKPGAMGRLVVDYSPINSLIQSPPSIIPEISATLQRLSNKCIFTSIDLRYAFLALRIDEESRKLTTFLTPSGSFQWLALPTGAANSPSYFSEKINKALHYKVEKDENGHVIYESENVVKMKKDPLEHTWGYFDDIMTGTDPKPTYEETIKQHFIDLEETISRLAFHGAKINVPKCSFCKPQVLFLGWIISHNIVQCDPRRLEKIKEYKFPNSKKSIRAFLGLVNSLRRVITLDIVREISILTPLTSSKGIFEATEEQKQAFDKIKELMTQRPLFNYLINPSAPKIIFVDAATSTGMIGGVLCQKINASNNKMSIPNYLNLSDPIHQVIYDKNLPYQPAKLYTSIPIQIERSKIHKTEPPPIFSESELLGFDENTVDDSFFWSLLSVLAIYGCKVDQTPRQLRAQAVKKLRQSILNNKLKDFEFNLNYKQYKEFLDEFAEGKGSLDSNFYLAEALAQTLYRPIIIISSLKRHKEKGNIIKLNNDSYRPPIILGLYQKGTKEIFTPFFTTKNTEFSLDSLKDDLQIVAYLSKKLPEAFRSRPILDLEVFAILNVLHSFHKYISGVEVTLLTDSRVLYYLFNQQIGASSVKIRRWCLKLISDYPLVRLKYIRTNQNLSDFLTREGLKEGDKPLFNLKDITISDDLANSLPKDEFTLTEWAEFCSKNPQFLQINDSGQKRNLVLALNRGIENVKEIYTPLLILKEKASLESIMESQIDELGDIRSNCLKSKDFTYIQDKVKYKLENGLLMAIIDDLHPAIVIPPSKIGILLAHAHLQGHAGVKRMILALEPYYFPKKYTLVKQFSQSCYSCFLSQIGNKKVKIGIYPCPTRPFQELYMDLLENLNPIKGYSHILVSQCAFSDFLLLFPMKSKTSTELTKIFFYNIFQSFNIEKIHTDNGALFRNKDFLSTASALGIKVIASASLHPSGRGQIERTVGLVKKLMKKLLAANSKNDLNWELLPICISKSFNHTISPKTNFKPFELVFGTEGGITFSDMESYAPPHYFVKSDQMYINGLNKQLKEMVKIATKNITELREQRQETLNKNRIEKHFKTGDYVFTIDNIRVPGNSRVLKTTLNPSPYVVLRPLYTSTLVKRLADGFTTLYPNKRLKAYNKIDPLFNTLPKEVVRVLLNDFQNLLEPDLQEIIKVDNLDVPTGIVLYNDDEIKDRKADVDFQGTENINDPSFSEDLQELQADLGVDPIVTNLLNEESSDEEDEISLPGYNLRPRGDKRVQFAS